MSLAETLEPYLDSSPSPLVALVGEQAHHAALMELAPGPPRESVRYLSADADTAAFDYCGGASGEQPTLILKRDWLHKHTHVVADPPSRPVFFHTAPLSTFLPRSTVGIPVSQCTW